MKIENSSNKDTSGMNKSQNKISNSSGKNRIDQSNNSNNSEKDTNSNIGNRRHYVGGEHRSSQGHVFHDDASDKTTK